MKFTYDKEVDALHIAFGKGEVSKTLELSNDIFLDIDTNGMPIYLEVLNASKTVNQKSEIAIGNKNFTLNDLIAD